MKWLVTLTYFLVCCWLIYRWKLFYIPQVSRSFLIAVFLVKCMAGMLYWHIHITEYNGADTLIYYKDGRIIYNTLHDDPGKYLELTFGRAGGEIPEHLAKEIDAMSFWKDSSAYAMVRFNSLLHLISFDTLYVHSTIMCFLSLIGLVLLYKAVVQFYKPDYWITGVIFLIPSVVFWTSGVHKEGWLMFCLGLFIYSATILLAKKIKISVILGFLVAVAIMMVLRDYFLMLLLPAVTGWWICRQWKLHPAIVFPVLYTLIVITGLWLQVGGMNYIDLIAYKQIRFQSLGVAESQIPVYQLDAGFDSFLAGIPIALKNTFLGPFLIKLNEPIKIAAFAENIGLLIIIAVLIIRIFLNGFKPEPLAWWFLFWSISLMVVIGFIVPNVGAIVRYRSLAIPFILLALVLSARQKAASV